jgi:hypothetical protein
MDRSSDYSLEDTYQWLKKEFPAIRPTGIDVLAEAITEKLARAYRNGRDDGRATAAEDIIKTSTRLYP